MSGSVPAAAGFAACALGPLGYAAGLELQEALVRARAAGAVGDLVLFPDHPPVLTVGRGGREDSLRADRARLARLGLEVFDVARGGDVTWHGPGQLVGYPICDLAARGRDLHAFLRSLERALIETLAGFGIAGRVVPGRTGVWVGQRKIASIGIAVRRWVSYHGFALNVAPDLAGFDLIHPCGLRGIQMTSMARERPGDCPPLEEVREAAAQRLAAVWGVPAPRWVAAAEIRALAAGESGAASPPIAAGAGRLGAARGAGAEVAVAGGGRVRACR